jgi:hypothetical protein
VSRLLSHGVVAVTETVWTPRASRQAGIARCGYTERLWPLAARRAAANALIHARWTLGWGCPSRSQTRSWRTVKPSQGACGWWIFQPSASTDVLPFWYWQRAQAVARLEGSCQSPPVETACTWSMLVERSQ